MILAELHVKSVIPFSVLPSIVLCRQYRNAWDTFRGQGLLLLEVVHIWIFAKLQHVVAVFTSLKGLSGSFYVQVKI